MCRGNYSPPDPVHCYDGRVKTYPWSQVGPTHAVEHQDDPRNHTQSTPAYRMLYPTHSVQHFQEHESASHGPGSSQGCTPLYPSEIVALCKLTVSNTAAHATQAFSDTRYQVSDLVDTDSPTSRRKLTDDVRREMCIMAQDHPKLKQRQIGAMFNVERR